MRCPGIVFPPVPPAFLFLAIARATYTCVDFTVPISITAETFSPVFPEFENHYQSVAFLTAISGRNPSAGSPWVNPVNTTLSADIYTQYCRPNGVKGVKSPSNVQVLSHGLGFDHSYWDFGGPDSEYNYIKSATEAGYATLSYDRIGNGKSTILDPYTEEQLNVEVAIVATLTKSLRDGKLSSAAGCHIPTPKKVVHVGHSFGSLITGNLAGSAPELSDGIVLTGYSTDTDYLLNFAVATNFHLASEADPVCFAGRSTGYLTWIDELAYQQTFFHYPDFDPAVLAEAEASRYPFAIGELLQPYDVPFPAWKGPILMIAGQYDYFFCGTNCTGILPKGKQIYLNASPFETYIQPDAAHALNLHKNATGFYSVVNDFVKRQIGV